MTPQEQDALWKRRFIILNLTRIGGTIVVLIGLLIWHSDVAVEGGSMAVGLPMALIGLAVSFLGPKQLAEHWKRPPGP